MTSYPRSALLLLPFCFHFTFLTAVRREGHLRAPHLTGSATQYSTCFGPNSADCWKIAREIRQSCAANLWQEDRTPNLDIVPCFHGYVQIAGKHVHLPNCTKPDIYYRHIFKSAGWFIEASLNVISGHLPTTKDAGHGLDTWNIWGDYSDCAQLSAQPRSSTLFTYVREPLKRFVSGYAEIEGRGQYTSLFRQGSIERAQAFLEDALHGRLNSRGYEHISLQVEFLIGYLRMCPVAFDFIGRLESMEEDWHDLGAQAGCTPNQFPYQRSVREVASHANDVQADSASSMRKVLGNRLYMRKLCWYLMPDFLILNYTLPPECM